MRSLSIVLTLLASVSIVNGDIQQSFSAAPSPDEYHFKWPIRRVAIIGAGPSGLVAYRELTEAGLDVRIFERDNVPGGNWHYTEEIPLDAPIPNAPCAVGDFVPWLPLANVDLPYSEEFVDDGEIRRGHRGPKPIWESLTSNVPSHIQKFPQWPWPPGTQWERSHYHIRNYVRSYASYLHINSNDENPATAYNTRVELVEKRINESGEEQGWRLWLRSLHLASHNTYNVTWWTEDFDAVVVATGRYNAAATPSIPGLREWVQRFPDLIRHSRQYRRPEAYANQTVLIIGASVSGAEISRDLNHHARNIYQSVRPAKDKVSRAILEKYIRRIPRNTTIVSEIKEFLPIPSGSSIQCGLVKLTNGTILTGFDSVILATGFRYSFPFLSQYYDGAHQLHAGSAETTPSFLPANGLYIRDLYLNLFYTQDPTLAFISMTLGGQTFLLLDYTTLALAKVWTNMAKLPSSQTMQATHEKTVEERGGYGKYVFFMDPEYFTGIIRNLTGWLNEAAVKYGGKQIDGYPKQYNEVTQYWQSKHFGEPMQETLSEDDDVLLGSLGLGLGGGTDQEVNPLDDGDWSYYGYHNDW